eukprot:2489546-Ditylum_brightwellii.AAC.1
MTSVINTSFDAMTTNTMKLFNATYETIVALFFMMSDKEMNLISTRDKSPTNNPTSSPMRKPTGTPTDIPPNSTHLSTC